MDAATKLERDAAFGGAKALFEQWAKYRGHLFDSPLALLSRALSLSEAARLSCEGDSERVRFDASALSMRHANIPRAPFDPAAFGEGWPHQEKVIRDVFFGEKRGNSRLPSEQAPPPAHVHIARRIQERLLELAEITFDAREQLRDNDGFDGAHPYWLWVKENFPPQNPEQRFFAAALPCALAQLLLAKSDKDRLKAAALLLSLTRRFASRKWVSTVQGEREARESGHDAPSSALRAPSPSREKADPEGPLPPGEGGRRPGEGDLPPEERSGGGEVPALPPTQSTAPT